MRTAIRFTLPSVLVTIICGCVARGPQADGLRSSTTFIRAKPQSRTDRLDREDLSTVDRLSLDVAVRQLRSEWFRLPATPRLFAPPTMVSVYIDFVYAGGVDALRLVPVSAVHGVRHLTPSAARDRFGSECPCSGGVILVLTRTIPDLTDGLVPW